MGPILKKNKILFDNLYNTDKNAFIVNKQSLHLTLKLVQYLKTILPVKWVNYYFFELNELYIKSNLKDPRILFYFLKQHTFLQFKTLSDIIAVDEPGKHFRFKVFYQLLSIHYSIRLNLLFYVTTWGSLFSIWKIFEGSLWYEREVWDLYGIFFKEHKDLRRILTDYSFDGHPLRKDFPLSGFFELFYDDQVKRIQYEPVALAQEFRIFFFEQVWSNSNTMSIKN